MNSAALHIVIALAPVAACLGLFLLGDVFRLTPLAEILELLAAGAVVCIVCYFVAGRVIDTFPLIEPGAYSQAIAPVLEETLKALVIVALFAMNRVGYLIDAAILGFSVGAGFALAENIFYLAEFPHADLGVWLVRGLGTAIMHGGATAILAVVSHVLYAPRLRVSADRFRFNALLFLPGLVGAIALHAVFNQFTHAPLAAMMVVMVAVPVSIWAIFSVGEKYAHRWLTAGRGEHVKLLADIDDGVFAGTPDGRALQRVAERLGAELGPVLFEYLRAHTDLVVRAEDRLLALEAHDVVARQTEIRARFRRLHQMEARLGRAAVLAVRQHLRFSRGDLWEMHALEAGAPSRN